MKQVNISYLNRDYQDLIAQLKEIIPQLTDDWTDLSDSDVGIFLISIMAAIKDMQSYELETTSLEHFISTCKERGNFQEIVKPLGYMLPSYKATKVSANATATVNRFEKFAAVGTEDSLIYVHMDGASSGAVDLYEGSLSFWPTKISNDILQNYSDTTGKTISSRTMSTTYLCSFPISAANAQVAIDSSIQIVESIVNVDNTVTYNNVSFLDTDGNTIYYEQVENFIDDLNDYPCEATSGNPLLYRLYVGRDNRTYIEFYDIAPLMVKPHIQIAFLETNGSKGTIGNTVTLRSTTTSTSLTPTSITAGEDPISLEEALVEVQKYVRSTSKAVTLNDYEVLTTKAMKNYISNSSYSYNDTLVIAIDSYFQSPYWLEDSATYAIDNTNIKNNQVYVFGYSKDAHPDAGWIYVTPLILENLTQQNEIKTELGYHRMVGVSPVITASDFAVTGNTNFMPKVFRMMVNIPDSISAYTDEIRAVLNEWLDFSAKNINTTVTTSMVYKKIVQALPDTVDFNISDLHVAFSYDQNGHNDVYGDDYQDSMVVKANHLLLLGDVY